MIADAIREEVHTRLRDIEDEEGVKDFFACGCDLIVCWIHDWKDCPLEVRELKTAIEQLPG